MDIKDYVSGTYRDGYQYRYFMPEKINHPWIWTDETINALLETASLRLGELNSFSRLIPDTNMFIIMHVFKEAVISSRIEGTRTNIEEALVDEKDIDPERRDDWLEVNNYVRALSEAIEELKTLPLSCRLIRNAHRALLSSGRGERKAPGEFRLSQNWIGGVNLADAVFVPPAHTELPELLSDFEAFLNNGDLRIPHLIRIAIAHYQFETIHPFLDGNGRIGRVLIALYLVSSKMLGEPLLYLSEFFEKNRGLYYDNLTMVREKNDLDRWLRFFLTGVIETADKSCETLRKIIALKGAIEKEHIMTMGKRSKQALDLFHGLFRKPIASVRDAQALTGLTPKAANDLVQAFVERGILTETTGYRRNRVFLFADYMELFDARS
jgi:Fic family protein